MFHSSNTFATAMVAFFCLLKLSNSRFVIPRLDQDQMTCSFYTSANTSLATCNEQPNVVCTKGCTGNFVTATQCTPVNGPEGTAPSTQVCSIGFGRDTARAKACINEMGAFSCTGQTSGSPTCNGCQTLTN
ncbi:hypothetical protein BY996DRAFT_3252849 [Phakopsora pachyrhizi]|uniref:Secreted protein n=1 Tax=Phakopsora pachyrhizi TaxID=170000 RepID=A0A0S1MJ05_PHAPC|nr:hypothetical protein BY996DRAFT_3252849 [Phakopsora pachyrhizi]CAH7666362.1 hypothetical protein PPACK8108_LOCUS712 [Phakopsora pachyrhizi]